MQIETRRTQIINWQFHYVLNQRVMKQDVQDLFLDWQRKLAAETGNGALPTMYYHDSIAGGSICIDERMESCKQ